MTDSPDLMLAVDVGGTKIAALVTDVDRRVLAQTRFATPEASGPDAWCREVARYLAEMIDSTGLRSRIAGIFFATVGPSVFRDGKLHIKPPNIKSLMSSFTPYPHLVAKELDLPYASDNDGHCMLAAEANLPSGSLVGRPDAAVLLWSSGVGGAIQRNGEIVHFGMIDETTWAIPMPSDKDGNSPEWGHWIVEDDPKQIKRCNDGALGHLEGQIGGSAMESRGDKPADFHKELMDEGLVYLPRALANFLKDNEVAAVSVSGTIGKTLLETPSYSYDEKLTKAFSDAGVDIEFVAATFDNPSLEGAQLLGLRALHDGELRQAD
jgi:predicted NBD/HSP70 family sugar kinase